MASHKSLKIILAKNSGRDNQGHIAVRHQGGRQKRFYRLIDWKRDKTGVPARVISMHYDPNRSAEIALLHYKDGEKRFILSPVGLAVNQTVMSGVEAEIKPGNAMPLSGIPVGTLVHCLEIKPGSGAKLIRGAGVAATLLSKDAGTAQVKLPSGEVRLFSDKCMATIGQLGNVEWRNRVIGKAGTARRLGRRPAVRGVAMNPRSHPHGGGEGRSGIGLPSPKSPWGKPTLGKRTRKRVKYSDRFILERRKGKK